MSEQDRTLIEATRTHRGRMVAALTFGADSRTRTVNNNAKRVVGSVVLAAVVCVGCLGFAFVRHLLTSNNDKAAVSAYSQALAANPVQPTGSATTDPGTGFIVGPDGTTTDPKTGWRVDPATGLEKSSSGRWVDPRTGWYVDLTTCRQATRATGVPVGPGRYVDLATCYRTDPVSGTTIDPATMSVVHG